MRLFLCNIGLLFVLVSGELSCQERCCNNKHDHKANSTGINAARHKYNSSSCLKHCRQSQDFDSSNDSKEYRCKNDKEGKVNNKNTTENVRKKTECIDLTKKPLATNNFAARPEDISVHFKQEDIGGHTYYYANVTWKPPLNITGKNWTHYAVLWTSVARTCHFALVPKNQSFFVINLTSSTYEYPDSIYYNVYTYPFKLVAKSSETYILSEYVNPITPEMFDVTLEPKPEVTTRHIAAVIVGSCIGMAFCIALGVAWRFYQYKDGPLGIWGKKPKGPDIEENERQLYLSYFKEDDTFMVKIVAIVQALTDLGFNVLMDKMYTNEQAEEGQALWSQNRIASSSKVIVVCSPRYIDICQRGKDAVTNVLDKCEETRVWFEIQILNNIYTKNKSASKIVCLRMSEGNLNGLPPWMGVTYTWPHDLEKIIKRLKSPNRNGKTFSLSSTSTCTRSSAYSVTCFNDVFEN